MQAVTVETAPKTAVIMKIAIASQNVYHCNRFVYLSISVAKLKGAIGTRNRFLTACLANDGSLTATFAQEIHGLPLARLDPLSAETLMSVDPNQETGVSA